LRRASDLHVPAIIKPHLNNNDQIDGKRYRIDWMIHNMCCPGCSQMVTDRADDKETGGIIASIGCDTRRAWYCCEGVGMRKREEMLPAKWFFRKY